MKRNKLFRSTEYPEAGTLPFWQKGLHASSIQSQWLRFVSVEVLSTVINSAGWLIFDSDCLSQDKGLAPAFVNGFYKLRSAGK